MKLDMSPVVVFDVQMSSGFGDKVSLEFDKMFEGDNNDTYYPWDWEDEQMEEYPEITKLLTEHDRSVNYLINWWW